MTDPPDREAEPAELRDRRLSRRRPDELGKKLARLGALDGDVVQLVGRGAHPGLETHLFRLLPEPDPAEIIAADPAEVVLAETEQRPVVDHAAMFVAHRGVDDLAGREL